jgi:hypothetical protein
MLGVLTVLHADVEPRESDQGLFCALQHLLNTHLIAASGFEIVLPSSESAILRLR